MLAERRYRPNVAAVVIDGRGHILACERSDMPGSWQLPQGGIDRGETPEQALRREVYEEIGVENFEIVWQLPEIIRYDWPPERWRKNWQGQEQFYFLVRLSPDAPINLTCHKQEFVQTEWITREEFIERLTGFKRDAYVQALTLIHLQFPDLI